MGKFIQLTDTYLRKQVFDVNDVRAVIDYGDYRRIYFYYNASISVNQSFDELSSIIRRYRGQIIKI